MINKSKSLKMKNTLLILLTIFCWNATISAQQITGTTGKIWYHDQVIYANIVDKGVLVIDNKNPKEPKKLGFIEIPGNVDIAVIDEVLIANNNDDLIAINISELEKINNGKILRRFNGIFPQHGTGSENIAWVKAPKGQWASSEMSVANSQGGSMACLTIVGNNMYAINGEKIYGFDVSKPKKITKYKHTSEVKGDVFETIFSTDDNLFIGGQKGMYIYSFANPKELQFVSMFDHAQSCDPVVVEGDRAYITLRNDVDCRRGENLLAVVDISNPTNPSPLNSIPTINPHGLAVDCGYVYLCDGNGGFKVINATQPSSFIQVEQQYMDIQKTYDVIALQREKILIMVGDGKLIQYNYTDKTNLEKLSEISVDL